MQSKKEIENCQLEIKRLNVESQKSLNSCRIIHEEDREKWQRERETLNSELGMKDGEIEALKSRMDGLVKENETVSVLIGEKDGHVERLLLEIRSLELQEQEVKAEIEQWRERVTDVERQNMGLLEIIKESSEELQIKEKENAKRADIIKMRDSEIDENCKRIEKLIENARLQDSLTETLKRELNEKEIGITVQINKEMVKQKEREAEVREKEMKLNEELNKKEKELERFKDNVEELKMEKQQISHLLHERDTYLEKLKNKVINLEQTDVEMQDELEWWKKKAGDVERDKEVLMKKVENHISVEQERDELVDQLRERDEVMKKVKKNEQDMMSVIERMKEEQREQEKELKQRDAEVEEHKGTIENMVKEKNEQEKWKMQLEELRKKNMILEEKKNQLKEGEQKMKGEINVLKLKISELDRENREAERKVLEQKDQLQIQTVLLKERELAVNRLRETLGQKELQENKELVTLKEKIKETELVQENERNKHMDYDQKLQLAKDKINQLEGKVKELEVKHKSLIHEADMARTKLNDQFRELETKSKLLLENEANVKGLKSRVESREEEKKQLKRSLEELTRENKRLKIELRERNEEEETRLDLERQLQELGEDLRGKDEVLDALRKKTDLILKQKEEQLKEANKNYDAMSTEVTMLREEATVLSKRKEKAETMVKERDLENKTIKDGLKAGLEEMITLKELLEQSHCEGVKLRMILEEKKNEMMKGRKEEVRAAREETECLKLRVQILQKANKELQAQLWIKEENDIKMNSEDQDIKKVELKLQETAKMTLDDHGMNNNDKLQKHEELWKGQKNNGQKKASSFQLISLIREKSRAEEEKSESIRMENTLEEQEVAKLKSQKETNIKSLEVVQDEPGEKSGTDTMKKEIKANEKNVEKQSVYEVNARHLLGEQLNDAQMDIDILKTKLERDEQSVMTNLENTILVEKKQEKNTIVNSQTKMDFQTKEFQCQTQSAENAVLQAEVYDLKKEVQELRKDRDRLRTALEKNEAMLIHYQEKAHNLQKNVQVRNLKCT